MKDLLKVHEKMKRTRLTLGIPTLVICVLLTVIFMAARDHIHWDFVAIIVVAWTAGFAVRGLVDHAAEAAEDAVDMMD